LLAPTDKPTLLDDWNALKKAFLDFSKEATRPSSER